MADKNRVLIELPERLRKANEALREYEDLFANLQLLYAQRVILNDKTVLDQIGELIGAPELPVDPEFLPQPPVRRECQNCGKDCGHPYGK
jgi:hypothetical protein